MLLPNAAKLPAPGSAERVVQVMPSELVITVVLVLKITYKYGPFGKNVIILADTPNVLAKDQILPSVLVNTLVPATAKN
jgi:hypothetical protein